MQVLLFGLTPFLLSYPLYLPFPQSLIYTHHLVIRMDAHVCVSKEHILQG